MSRATPSLLVQIHDAEMADSLKGLLSDLDILVVDPTDKCDVDPLTLKAILIEHGVPGFSEDEVSSWMQENPFLTVLHPPASSSEGLAKLYSLTTKLMNCKYEASEIASHMRPWVSGFTEDSKPPTSLMIVDDEENLRSLLVHFLLIKGFEVRAAEDGQIAFDFFKKRPISLVISDVYMPHMNGIQLLESVKELNEEIPILMMTGYSSAAEVIPNVRHINVDVVTKPFRLLDFGARITKLLGGDSV